MSRVAGTCVTLAILLAGCGGGASDAPATVAVSGTVTLDDAPLEGATVAFVDPTGKNASATGATDSAGKYTLHTGANAGAIPGSYNVSISRLVGPEGAPIKPEEGIDIEQLKTQGQVKETLARSYVEGTELKAEVKSGAGPIEFKLKSGGEVADDAGTGAAP